MIKILVIDDEQLILNYFTRIQLEPDYEIVTAQSGEDGVQIAQDQDIKLIFTDFAFGDAGLQKMDLVRELKRVRPELPLVVITGYPSDDIIEECKQLGVTDFLTKPFELSFVRVIIKRLLPLSP